MSTSAIYYLPTPAATPPTPRPARGASVAASDIYFHHTEDGGELVFLGGEPVKSDGLEAAAYISLFGGNDDDNGQPSGRARQWWGNFSEQDPTRWLRSETQYLLATLPPTTGNLRRLEAAAKADLAWLVSSGIASQVEARASMPARNSVALDIALVVATGAVERFNFPRTWGT